jgi:VCBS repeat-containing protein
VTQTVTPYYQGKAEPGSKVEVLVNGQTYLDTAGPDGSYKVAIKNALPGGVYTPKITVTDAKTGLSTTSDGTPFTVDNASDVNQPNGVADDNVAATLQITTLRGDTGESASDFITQDNTLVYEGRVDKFVRNGDMVQLVLKNAAGEVVSTQHVSPNATGVWTWDNSAAAQNDGRYILSAAVVDAAGNVVTPDQAVASQVVLISTHALVAVADQARAVEAGVSNPTGTSATGNVLSNDTVVDAADAKKAKAETLTGHYGVLTLSENGDYTYLVDNTNPEVNALRGATSTHGADTLSDVFTYQVTDAAGQLASSEIQVTIEGANDAARFTGTSSATLTTNDPSRFTQGQLNISDPDLGEADFQTPTQLNGAYGAFTFNLKGGWTYTLGNDQVFTDSRHDLLTVSSLDGLAFETIDVWINKNVDPVTGVFSDAMQAFSTANPTGLAVSGKTNVTDLLLLNGTGLTLDLTARTTHVSSVEKIDLTGAGPNTAIVNLDSVLQADAVNGVHKLYVLGNAGDSVQIQGGVSSVDNTSVAGYNLYHLNSSNDLLIQQAVHVVL